MRKTITDENGQVLERLSFDPWGRRRNPNTWEYTNTPSNFKYDRGYTGHEHLDDFGLINMNGRVYDPQLAWFLSPDPFVQSPLNMQSYNRYSYALNNPLKYIDPSGYVSDNPYADGSIAPGSGNHWSDQMRSPFMNAMFSNEYYIDRTYGEGTYENLMSRRGAKEAELIYNPVAGEEIKRDVYQNGNIIHHDIYYSGSYVLSISNAANGGEPDYSAQSFSQSGFQGSWTSAEGVGQAGGFFYSLYVEVIQNINGDWYVYAKASAMAPAAEIKADFINYYSTITVLENGITVNKANLQIWNPNITRIGQENFTYIGDGYMPLPTTGNNISVEINITYNMYQFLNGHSFPQTPYVHTINF